MSLKTYHIDVPITPGVMPPVIHIGQYDSGREYVAHLKNDDGTDYTVPSGATATFTGCNPRKEVFEIEATARENTVTFQPSDEATAAWGKYGATINITAGGEKMSPIVILMDVQKAGSTDEEIAGAANFPNAVTEAVNDWLEDNIEAGQLGSLFIPQAPQAAKTSEMTQPVGMDGTGKLWTTPGGGSGAVNPVGMGFAYSTSSTAQATATKTTGTVSGFALKQYAIVVVRFSNPVNSGQKLNFSGTGAKDIYFRNAAIGSGVIEAGDTVAFQYDGTRYRVISIDKTPVSPTFVPTVYYFATETQYNGAADNILPGDYVLIGDGTGAISLNRRTQSGKDFICEFVPGSGGGGGSATWADVLPSGGIRQTDIAKLTVTFTQQGNGYTASSNLTQVLAALNDNKAVECKLGDHIGELVYAHQDAQDTSADFAIFKVDGMFVTYSGQEGEERYPSVTVFYMTHMGVTYQEVALGGTCYCYVAENNGVYDIDTESTPLTAQSIVGLLSAYYAGVETQMIVYDGYQRWTYPVIAHYGQAEIAFGGLEQAIEDGNVVNYLVSYTFSAQNAHIIRNRRRAAGGMDVPAPGTGDNGKVWMAGADGTAGWQTPPGGSSTPVNAVLYTSQSLTTAQKTQARTNIGAGTGSYSKPSSGIPKTDLASAVQTSLNNADSAYQLPLTGISEADLATESVVISPDTEHAGQYVSSRTYSQIAQASSDGFAIKPEFWPDNDTTIRGAVLDISSTASVFAFLDMRTTPTVYVFTVNAQGVSVDSFAAGGGSGPEIPTPTGSDNGKYLGVANGVYTLRSAPSGGGATIYSVNAVFRSGYWYIQHDGMDIAAEDIFTALSSGALVQFSDDAGAEGDLLEVSYNAPGYGRLLYRTSNMDNGTPGWRLFEIADTVVQGIPRAAVTMTPVELLPVSDSYAASSIASGFTVEGNKIYTVSSTVGGFTLITSTRPTMLPGQAIEIRLTVGSSAITTPTWPSWCKFMGGWDGKFEADTYYDILIDDAGNVYAASREVSA